MVIDQYSIVLLTQKDYVNPLNIDPYIDNILTEDRLLTQALEQKGFSVTRTHWDNESFDWQGTDFALFRATWDYFHRFDEFHYWLKNRSQEIRFINPVTLIQWNMDKHYLDMLRQKGINIPPTLFLEQGTLLELKSLIKNSGWNKVILKPAIAGGARHTYLLNEITAEKFQDIFQQLISKEAMLLQEFQEQVISKGEVSFMVFGGKYSHAVLKKVKAGDFRVQDDFGGSLHPYNASEEEKSFVERVVAQCEELPVYARVDVMWDNQNNLCISELELIEPELWFRKDKQSASSMANAVADYINANYQPG